MLVRQEAVVTAQPRSLKPFQVELLLRQGSSSMDLPQMICVSLSIGFASTRAHDEVSIRVGVSLLMAWSLRFLSARVYRNS